MKRTTKWMMIAFVLGAAACTSDTADEPQVNCERVDVDDTEYCIYQQPITETGYQCPADLSNPIPFEGRTVCSASDELPQEHEAPIREHFSAGGNMPDADDDTTDARDGGDTSELTCGNVEAAKGRATPLHLTRSCVEVELVKPTLRVVSTSPMAACEKRRASPGMGRVSSIGLINTLRRGTEPPRRGRSLRAPI